MSYSTKGNPQHLDFARIVTAGEGTQYKYKGEVKTQGGNHEKISEWPL